jgi:Cu2+-exporting ATPase
VNIAGAALDDERLRESRFSVPGMSCAGCIAKVERGLGERPGVHLVRVNFSSKQATVTHDVGLGNKALVAALDDIGFAALPIVENEADAADKQIARELYRAMAVAGFAAMNVMLLSVSIWSGADGSTRNLFHWISALIALPAIAYAGRPFFRSALGALARRRTNMDVPIAIGVTIAAGMSLFETITGGEHAWFEGALMLLFFLLVGRALDQSMRYRVRDGITALARQTAPGALVIAENGTSEWHESRALRPGMQILVAAGEGFAADGVVIDGQSTLDLSLLTGESMPQAVNTGAAVFAGTVNLDAPLTVRVTGAADETALAEIGRLMETAGQSKSRYVQIADRASRLYAPVVHGLALAAFAGWMVAGAGWHQSLLIAVAVLIITCPCALGLAVPVANVAATGALMRKGILVKQGSALERLAKVDRVVLDKTGTLTTGSPVPQDLDKLGDSQKSIALALARSSRHPLSTALRETLENQAVRAVDLDQLAEVPGQGVTALWQGQKVALGKADGFHTLPAVALSIGETTSECIEFVEVLRPDARQAIRDLEGLGLTATILSGDGAESCKPVSTALGLTAQAGASPAEKYVALERLRARGETVLMVGDGLNDGPALNAAHVSIAPASASDVGQNAADIVFLNESLLPLPFAVRAARRTMTIVRLNFGFAVGYNVIAIPLAVAGFVTPLVAAASMSASSIIVIANSLRLRRLS